MWFIGVEVEQEMSAPLLKKILDPPLFLTLPFYILNFASRHWDPINLPTRSQDILQQEMQWRIQGRGPGGSAPLIFRPN